MFSYADLKFDSVADKDGKMHPLSPGVFTKLLASDDEVLRKNTFNTYYDNYADHINMLAATLKAAVKKNIFRAEVRNFKSAREAALFANAVDEKIYDNLIESVHDKIHYLHRYMKLRKKYMGLKEQHMYDIYMP
ncbi:MAG: M3 family metallopeptidase, partial [Fenollaria timonensis]